MYLDAKTVKEMCIIEVVVVRMKNGAVASLARAIQAEQIEQRLSNLHV